MSLASASDPYGLWEVFGILSVFLALPFVVILHECGHFIAGRLLGLRILEFNIGSGKILWKKHFRGIHFILRAYPMNGHVAHLNDESVSRFSKFIFILAGPASNLVIAFFVGLMSGVSITDFYDHTSLYQSFIVANLITGITSLVPFNYYDANTGITGSDGWQLLRLLQGKPSLLTPDEIKKPKTKVGLNALFAYSQRVRVFEYVFGFIIGIVGVLFGLAMIPITYALTKTRSVSSRTGYDPSVDFAIICTVSVFVILSISCLILAAFTIRKAKSGKIAPLVQIKFNPLKKFESENQLMIAHYAGNLGMDQLSKEEKLEIFSMRGNPDCIDRLIQMRDMWSDLPIFNAMLFDLFIQSSRYTEAVDSMSSVLNHGKLSQSVYFSFETCLLIARILASTDDKILADCESSLNSIADEGMLMSRLCYLSQTIVMESQIDRYAQAEKWLERARAIYPYDASIFTSSGVINLEKNNLDAAAEDFGNAMKLANANQKPALSAWLAITSAMKNEPKAEKMLKACRGQNLHERLIKRLEEALQKLTESEISEA